MPNRYGEEVSKVLFKNIIREPNKAEPRNTILEEPKLISQETTTIKDQIETDLNKNDVEIDGVLGYKDLRFWYGKYQNSTKSFIAVTNIKDILLTTTTGKKVIDEIEIGNQTIDIPVIKYLSVTEGGELFGLWEYNSKVHFFRLVHFIEQIGNPTLVNLYPIVNTDVETEVVVPDEVKKGSSKFADYDLIDITRDENQFGIFSIALWKDGGVNDRKIVYMQINTSDLSNVEWEKNEDVNPSHVDGSLGTDFAGVSSLAVKINKTKFESAQKYDDNKILGSIWFATKSGSVTTTPKNINAKDKQQIKQEFFETKLFDRDLLSSRTSNVETTFWNGKKIFNSLKNENKLIDKIDKIDKIKNSTNITNFIINKITLKNNIFIKKNIDGVTQQQTFPFIIEITDQNIINNIINEHNNIYYNIDMKYSYQKSLGQYPSFEKYQKIDSIINNIEIFIEDLKLPVSNNSIIELTRSFSPTAKGILGNTVTGFFEGIGFSVETEFVFDYSYTQNITTNSINTASQILISSRDDKKQDTLYYDLAQNIQNAIYNSNKPIAFNYLNAYYPVLTNQTWQIWDFDGTRGSDYETPSTAKLVNDNSIWPDGNLIINSILDDNYGTSIVGGASDITSGIQGGSLGLNIYDGDGNGQALGVAEVVSTEFQEIKNVVGNREEDLMFWSAYNDDFSQKLNFMQVYPNSLSPYTSTPFEDYFKTTVIDRISIRKDEEFVNTKFDRAITNANVSNNVLNVTTIASPEDLNDNDNNKLILFSKSNRELVYIDTTNYQNKDRTQQIEINVSTTFKYNINGVTQNTPSVALARLHNNVKQEDLEHLQFKRGVITFSDNSTKEFDPFNDTTWEVFPDLITGQTSLLIRFGLVQNDINKKATKVQIFSTRDDLLNEVDLTTVPCTQVDWTDKYIEIELSTIVEI